MASGSAGVDTSPAPDGVEDVRAPSELPHAKLRRGRGAKKANTEIAVAHACDFLFAIPKLTMGPGYEFWDLAPAERDKLASSLVACMDALPAGKVAVAAKWISDVAPFVALAGTAYATLGWRIAMTRQLKAAQQGAGSARVAREGSGDGSGAGGTADTGTGAAPGADYRGGEQSGAGVGATSATLGNVGGVFTPPPHVRA